MVSLHLQQAHLLRYVNSYARVRLLDDDSKRLDHSTAVFVYRKYPNYNEHISWEMNDNDFKHQLQVSIYERHPTTGDADCIGYVTISLASLLTVGTIDRWLALSTIPRTKHITRRNQGHRRCSKQSVPQPPPVPLTKMMVLRSSTSEHFGLSVAGHGPTHIVRVQPNSCASRAALQAGDQLYSIGNINIQTYSQHRIVKLLKRQQLRTEFTVLRVDVNKTAVPTNPFGKIDVIPRTQSVPQHPPVPLTKMMVLRSSTSEHFGLSVAGHGPTHIVRVQPNSCASRAALQAGDQLYSIGNINVQTYSQYRIVKLLKRQQLRTEFTVLRVDVNKPTVPAHRIGKVDVLPRTQSTKFSFTVFPLCDINSFLTSDCRAE